MKNNTFKKLAIIAAGLFLSGASHANDQPIEIVLREINFDLSNPDATVKRVIDKNFKSNDPSMRSRIYKLNNGIQVKLVGQNFDTVSDIDKIRVIYPKNQSFYESSKASLTQSFGKPSSKRPSVQVWRFKNNTPSPTQGKTVKVIAGFNKTGKPIITVNRQSGGKGNNSQRGFRLSKQSIPFRKTTTELQQSTHQPD